MLLWRQFTRGARSLFRPARSNEDISAEVRQYFEDAIAAGMERGLSPQEAQREARAEIGNLSPIQEEVRSYGWENAVRTILFDLRYAARQLRTHRVFTIVSLVTLALGIGASTAIFSAVNPILLSPLPYPHPDRLLMIWNTWRGARFELSYGTYYELLQRNRSFDSMAIFEPWQPTLTGNSIPERLEGQSVSASFFRVLGIAPALGRDFVPAEEAVRGPHVVILSDGLWERLFHRDRGIIGRPIKLDDDNYTVIGVMPAGFEDVVSPAAALWTTAQYDPSQLATHFNSWAWEWGQHLRLIARVKPGVSRDRAIAEIREIARNPLPDFPRPRWASLQQGVIVDRLQDSVAHTVKPALLAIAGAVVLLLVIASVNVLNLLLARGTERRGEFAVRAALGASRRRVLRQLITETLLLSLLGGSCGVVVAYGGVHALISLSPPGLPRIDAIALDSTALFFALAVTMGIGLLTGMIPAIYLSRAGLHSRLEQSSRHSAGHHNITRRALVVTEVALALVLLVGTGLLLRSMRCLLQVDPGFEPDHLLTLQVQTSGHQFDELPTAPGAGEAARRRFFEQALDAVRRVPGVRDAAFTSVLPLSDDPPAISMYGARFENDPPDGGRTVFRYAVSPEYCQTMKIPLRSGRFLDERDTDSAPQSALISESLARSQFPHENAIGKRLHIGRPDRPWYTVVGVVGDIKQTSLAINDPAAVYLSTRQTWFADQTLSFVIRSSADPGSLAATFKNAIWSVDRNQPVVRVVTMTRLVEVSEAERRFVLILFAAFGIVALVLAAVGIYGVLSGSVSERTREIGMRVALGASRRNILTLVLRDGLLLTAIGMAIGITGALGASQLLKSLLFGISRLDPLTYGLVVVVLALVVFIACALPAWRASRIDPAITLRAE
ncbi:MAG TPA: ABC transporter permease [Terracidiphilus sp.]|nr:ABC transporter permease [Terracidiphilus sp.]